MIAYLSKAIDKPMVLSVLNLAAALPNKAACAGAPAIRIASIAQSRHSGLLNLQQIFQDRDRDNWSEISGTVIARVPVAVPVAAAAWQLCACFEGVWLRDGLVHASTARDGA